MPSGRKEKLKNKNIIYFFLYNLYSHALAQECLSLGSWNLQIFFNPFLRRYYYMVWSLLMFFKALNQVYTFYPKIKSLGVGIMTLTMLILHSLQVLHTKFIEDWLSSSWEEDVKGRRMKNYRNMLLRWQKNMYLIPRWGNSARVYVIGMLQLSIKQRLGIGEDYESYIYIYMSFTCLTSTAFTIV